MMSCRSSNVFEKLRSKQRDPKLSTMSNLSLTTGSGVVVAEKLRPPVYNSV